LSKIAIIKLLISQHKIKGYNNASDYRTNGLYRTINLIRSSVIPMHY